MVGSKLIIKKLPAKTGNITTSPVNKTVTDKNAVLTTSKLIASVATAVKSIQSAVLNIKNNATIAKPTPAVIVPTYVTKIVPKVVIKPPVIEKRNYLAYSNDKLNVSELKVKNNSFEANEIDQNISAKRPELLMVFNYNPVYIGNPKNLILSDVGKLLEVQHQVAYIRRDMVGELTLNIQNSTDKKNAEAFGNLLKTFNKKMNDLDSLVGSYAGIIKNKQEIEKKFNIKALAGKNYNGVKQSASMMAVAAGNAGSTSNSQQAAPGVREFVKSRMGYSDKQFDNFSNTKVYIQILADLKSIVENYSFNLLGLRDPDRINDISATKIDTTYTVNDDFSFTISKLRSPSTPINAANRDFFNKILSTLPTDSGARIKILINALSKEYRISSELGDPANKKILQDFGSADTGTPFDNILGLPGKTIFDLPTGEKSMLSLAQFKIDQSIKQAPGVDKEDFFVLPFEEKFINFEQSDKTYVPGKYYFADTIFETAQNAFNILPLVEYEKAFSSKFTSTKLALNTLLQLDTKNVLDSDQMFTDVLNACYSSINGMATDGDSIFDFDDKINMVGTDINQAIISSLFRLANEDNLLKNYLFQYLLLAGLSTNQTSETKIIWQSLINEFQTLDNFTALSYNASFTERDLKKGPDVVRPHLANLAKTIENRAILLITQNIASTKKVGTNSIQNSYMNETNIRLQDLDDNAISNALTVQATWVSNSSNFCKEYLNLAAKFAKAASIKNNEFGYQVPDKSGRTRYNFISTSTQLLMLFEIFSSCVSLFTKVELAKSRTKGRVAVRSYKNEQRLIFDVISQFITSKSMMSVASAASSGVKGMAAVASTASKSSTSSASSAMAKAKGAVGTQATTTKVASEKKTVSTAKTVVTTKKISTDFTNNYYYTVISDIIARLKKEDEIIAESLLVLESIKESLAQAKEIAESFGRFTQVYNGVAVANGTQAQNQNFLSLINDPDDYNAALATLGTNINLISNLMLLFQLSGVSAMNALTNITQIRNAAYIVRNLKERALNLNGQNPVLTQNPATGLQDNIIIANEVKSEIKDILFSYMGTADFTDANNAATRMKIMTVGVPNNFTKALQDRLNAKSIDSIGISSLQKKQSDVIKVKIYKRNMQYDDLIFKPMEFIFDLSVYVSETDLIGAKPAKNELYNNILQKVTISDYENISTPEYFYLNKTQSNKKAIITEQKYSFLTNAQKTDLFKNHVGSFLLQNLLYLSTGMTLNEEHFLTREEMNKIAATSFDKNFETILKTYFTNVLKQPVPTEKTLAQIQDDTKVNKNVRNIIKLYRTGNVLCNPDKLYNKAFGAKFFDRVFHIPVNIDMFEIDVIETRKTLSGRRLLNKTFLAKNIVTVDNKQYLKKRTDRDLILEDYFINIETLA